MLLSVHMSQYVCSHNTDTTTAREIDSNKSVGQEVTSPGVAMETANDGLPNSTTMKWHFP